MHFDPVDAHVDMEDIHAAHGGMRWAAIALLTVGGIILFSAAGFSTMFYQGDARPLKWPEVQGTVLETNVRQVALPNTSTELVNGNGAIEYVCDVRYEYVVAGTRYESDQVLASGREMTHPSLEAAQAWLAPRQPGSTIPVRYDPTDHANSAIVHMPPPQGWVLGAGFAAIGTLLFIGAGFMYWRFHP